MLYYSHLSVSQLLSSEYAECRAAINSSGTVDMESFDKIFPNSHVILCQTTEGRDYTQLDRDKLVGMIAVKAYRPVYKNKLHDRSGYELKEGAREIGYLWVSEEYRGRGIATELLRHAINSAESEQYYATIHNDSAVMHHINLKCGMFPEGRNWTGQSGNVLQLYVKTMFV